MAIISQLISIISLLFLSLAIHPIPAQEAAAKLLHVVVEGMVYCQRCDQYGTSSLDGAQPLQASATVRVVCEDDEINPKGFNKRFETNENGYFYAELKGLQSNLELPINFCKVTLVSSPLESCNLITNVNGGIDGAPLRYENKIISGDHYNAAIYATGPLAFADCPPTIDLDVINVNL
ncbi:hypothetical protein BUALT_Bualt01G0051900 [Buddleja alternifolia]|uniref:Uncharacterized protein n=1 Tax=Buddleja alternifolia TaxID=168488 RepID=A0AAV6Y5L4_9LAMI|nr:hypothetical protein BUALT_Bualt01G0051900 [Buddleja alternifolia]